MHAFKSFKILSYCSAPGNIKRRIGNIQALLYPLTDPRPISLQYLIKKRYFIRHLILLQSTHRRPGIEPLNFHFLFVILKFM